MARIYFLVAFVALAAVALAEQKVENIEVQFVEDINKFRTENPGFKLTPLSLQPKGQIRYTLGRRIGGDRLVAQANNSHNYPSLQDVQLRLNYPTSGIGSVVTYVEIVVNQSSNLGGAYVLSGGIGQRQISILVEAKRTNFFSYVAAIYGY